MIMMYGVQIVQSHFMVLGGIKIVMILILMENKMQVQEVCFGDFKKIRDKYLFHILK